MDAEGAQLKIMFSLEIPVVSLIVNLIGVKW